VASLGGIAASLNSELEALQSREARLNNEPHFAAELGRLAQLRDVQEGLRKRISDQEQQIQVGVVLVGGWVGVRGGGARITNP